MKKSVFIYNFIFSLHYSKHNIIFNSMFSFHNTFYSSHTFIQIAFNW